MEAEFKSILDAVRAIKIGLKTLKHWDDIYLVVNEKAEAYVVCDNPGQFIKKGWGCGTGNNPSEYANEFKVFKYQHIHRVRGYSKYEFYKLVKFKNKEREYARTEMNVQFEQSVDFWV
ncbi:hypothetical protein [Bacillus albus]|uniref:hypothetical protein n=1 Tax=Bacillus albus TaxID=2026189 RepID=UPI001020338F|nr:hypothetical protein [Bacillus albus]